MSAWDRARSSTADSARRGVNLLFNRATNDISIEATERDLRTAIRAAGVEDMAAALPDIAPDSPDFHPCMSAAERPVLPLARLHIRLPIVATPDGTVINGMGRLEAAARKGRATIPVVELAEEKADFASAMLNLLSMDFHFAGDNADFLRYGAFRREWLRRIHLGRAFVLPVYSHKRLADVALDGKFMNKWRQVCGDSVLDFGSGQGDEARMLRAKGIRVTEFEPYPADRDTVNREKGRTSAMSFLSAVRAGMPFSAIFVSSVLNSVPFPEDREHILRLVAALCGPETAMFLAARSTLQPLPLQRLTDEDSNWLLEMRCQGIAVAIRKRQSR
ncbi:methyltransferase domain-containing protein [Desulfovibrio sp. ZJ200]|uniref:methyltransferase domain-containing protein n=1 Tax=Desulfovibrio sp. ZJ200 TaxID=2709792 RepID=UPI001981C94A|nr:methyltransferase domain-containing protein [Desulfovibrio sp. ZJ200]